MYATRKPSPGDQLGSSGRGTRGSVQRTCPRVPTAIGLGPRTAATNSPWGDQLASRYGPRSRFEPSVDTSQAPSRELTSSRPGAGRERRAGFACFTPGVEKRALTQWATVAPVGEIATAATAATAVAATSGRSHGRLRRGAGACSIRSNSAAAISKARGAAWPSWGASSRRNSRSSSRSVTGHLPRQLVERAPQPRVHGAAREVEQECDLARRVVEHVAKHHDRAALGAERGKRRRELVTRLELLADRRVRRLHVQLSPQCPSAGPVDRAVHDDAVEPGPERPPPVEAVERPQGGEERLLGDVLSSGPVVHHEVGG